MNKQARIVSLLALTAGGLAIAGALSGLGKAAPVEPAAPAVSLPAFPASAVGDYSADNVHSSVMFKTTHAGVANFYGRFNSMNGEFTIAENPTESTFEFSIDTTSIDTNSTNRDDHLRSPDFFNTEQFDTATFTSTGIVGSDDGPHTLKGDLTLNGETKAIEADLTFTGTGEFRGKQVAGFEAVFTIKRSEFGITTYLGPIGDDVTVTIAVEGQKQ